MFQLVITCAPLFLIVASHVPEWKHPEARKLGIGSISPECEALFGTDYFINGQKVSVWDISAATEEVFECDPAFHPDGTPCGWGVYSYWGPNVLGRNPDILTGQAQGYCSYNVSSLCGDGVEPLRIPDAEFARRGLSSSVEQETRKEISDRLIAMGRQTHCYIADPCTARHCDQADRDNAARIANKTLLSFHQLPWWFSI